MSDFDLAAYLPEMMTMILAALALFVAYTRTQVQAAENGVNDRALELQMQGLYVEMSREDRAARDKLQERHDKLVENFARVQVQLTSVLGERENLKLLLETSGKLHKAEMTQMTVERDDLKRQISELKTQVEGLKNRIDDVGQIAEANQSALEKERQARLQAERERDAAIAERDKLREQVDKLRGEVEALRKQLEAIKANKENGL